MPNLTQAASLVRRETLAAEIHEPETQSQTNDSGYSVRETLDTPMRELQAQMGVLTREIQTHLVSPEYTG